MRQNSRDMKLKLTPVSLDKHDTFDTVRVKYIISSMVQFQPDERMDMTEVAMQLQHLTGLWLHQVACIHHFM